MRLSQRRRQPAAILALVVASLTEIGAAETASPPPAPAAAPALEVSISEVVLLALESNPEIALERYRPELARSFALEEQAVFDPLVVADDLGWQRSEGEKLRGQGIIETFSTDSPVGRLALESFLPSGTGLALEASTEVSDESQDRQLVQSRIGLSVSQALLRGLGPDTNQARVRAARIDAQISEYELRGFTEGFVALVEQTCWDYALYRRKMEILDEATLLAEQQIRDTETRVRVGTSARVELAAPRSELSLRNQERIDARSSAEKTRLQLLRLLGPTTPEAWSRQVRLTDTLRAADTSLEDAAAQLALAVRMRPDLNQARLLAARGELEIVRTKNGLLPRLDFFASFGRSGYADSFSASWSTLDGDYYDAFAGLRFEFPIRRSAARAQHQRAVAEKAQADKGIENLRQLVEMDVLSARLEVERARDQIVASSQTRQLDEEKLAAEIEKFRIGRASAFQVARAQRDLTRSRLAEAIALAEAQKALVEMHRLDGSLLSRRGIAAPGASPFPASGR